MKNYQRKIVEQALLKREPCPACEAPWKKVKGHWVLDHSFGCTYAEAAHARTIIVNK